MFALKYRHWVERWVERCQISHIGPAKRNFSAKNFCLKAKSFLIFSCFLTFFVCCSVMRCFCQPVKVISSRLYGLSLIRSNVFIMFTYYVSCVACSLRSWNPSSNRWARCCALSTSSFIFATFLFSFKSFLRLARDLIRDCIRFKYTLVFIL